MPFESFSFATEAYETVRRGQLQKHPFLQVCKVPIRLRRDVRVEECDDDLLPEKMIQKGVYDEAVRVAAQRQAATGRQSRRRGSSSVMLSGVETSHVWT